MLVAGALSVLVNAQAMGPLPPGMVITQNMRVTPNQYLRPSTDDNPAVVIRGDNITVDFQNALLLGSPLTAEPDTRKGVGVRVEGKNVILKNLRVRGYKIGVQVAKCPGFMLLDSDLSYNWKPRLKSTLEKEDLGDWMSFHQNERDEWLTKGAGVYISESDGFKLRNVRITGGQCGAMVTRSNDGTVVNCDFSFLSGVGLGLYRSSRNVVMHNKVDWCVRGYSHGLYNRGQDSAGILVYEQSNRNIFAYNSVTHGGDGFFLWAGQSTMDSGEGGCNDNLLYGNDFSHAPTNGIEATFSRNKLINNLIQECWHGVWGGYSYDSAIVANRFRFNATGIAIEHGQQNAINHNRFFRDGEALQIWQRATQPADWGYAKARETRSRDYEIRGNTFEEIANHVMDVRGVSGLNVVGNTFRSTARTLGPDPVAENFTFAQNQLRIARDESAEDLKRLTVAQIGARSNRTVISAAAKPRPALMRPDGNNRTEIEESTRDYLRRFEQDWNPIKEVISPHVKRYWVKPQTGGNRPYLGSGTLRGRRYILVNEWGPYDFRSPVLWPREERIVQGRRVIRFEILGPFGRWKVRQSRGVRLSAVQGQVPGFVDATIAAGTVNDLKIDLEYRGRKTMDHRGVEAPAGATVPFGWGKFEVPMNWRVRFWTYGPESDPREQGAAFRELLQTPPKFEETKSSLAYDFYGEPYPGGPKDRFATVAESTITVSPGNYKVSVSADDGVRLWVDDALVLNEWKYSPPVTYDRILKLTGRHRIRIEHFEIDGFAQLKFGIERAP